MGNQTARDTSTASDADAIEAADEKYVMRPWTHPAGEPVIVQRQAGNYVFEFYGNKQYIEMDSLIVDGLGGNTNSGVVITFRKSLYVLSPWPTAHTWARMTATV